MKINGLCSVLVHKYKLAGTFHILANLRLQLFGLCVTDLRQ